jgi:hypothetical protein
MCTAVDGGSIHRAARRISAASDHRSTTPMANHRTKDRRTKDRRKPLRSGVLGCVSGFSVTFQNNSLGGVAAYGFINAFQPGRHVPQGLKLACLLAVGGTAEAVPLQNKVTIRVLPLKRVGENSVVPPGLESFFLPFPALKCVGENYSFAPLGLHNLPLFTHGLRRGLHSYAASRLKILERYSTASAKL